MLKRLFNYIVLLQEKRAQYWMLQNLTDRELKDIGLSRAEIRRAIYLD
jgi:uncharacterized protein YjiS (DUF1127 family)